MCTLREKLFALSSLTRDIENWCRFFCPSRGGASSGAISERDKFYPECFINPNLRQNPIDLISIHTNTPSIASSSGAWQTTSELFTT
jgi:hypothetical protein